MDVYKSSGTDLKKEKIFLYIINNKMKISQFSGDKRWLKLCIITTVHNQQPSKWKKFEKSILGKEESKSNPIYFEKIIKMPWA